MSQGQLQHRMRVLYEKIKDQYPDIDPDKLKQIIKNINRKPGSGRRFFIRPAKLLRGCYMKPFALLEVAELWCGRREVWTASHGLATRYHVMVDGGMAACRAKQKHRWQPYSLIVLGNLIPIAEVPALMCCQRNGCRQLYEAYLA